MKQKLLVIVLVSLMILGLPLYSRTQSQTSLSVPILPSRMQIYGGEISVLQPYNIKENRYLENLKGLTLNEQLEAETIYPDLGGNWMMQWDGSNTFKIVQSYLSNERPVPTPPNFLESYRLPAMVIKNGILSSIVGPGCVYLSWQNLLLQYNDKTGNILFYDATSLEKLGQLENTNLIAVLSNRFALTSGGIQEIKTGKLSLDKKRIGDQFVCDGKLFVSTNVIFDLNKGELASEIGNLNIQKPVRIIKIKKDFIEYYSYSSGVSTITPTRTRLSKNGSLLETKPVNIKDHPENLQILDSFNDYALCRNSKSYRIIEMNSGIVVWEREYDESKKPIPELSFFGDKGLYRTMDFAEIINLHNFKTEKFLRFPLHPIVLNDSDNFAVILQSSENGDMVGFLLDDNFNIVPTSMTELPASDKYLLKDNEIVAYSLKTVIDNNSELTSNPSYSIQGRLSKHKFGSTKPYFEFCIDIPTNSQSLLGSNYVNGSLYITTSQWVKKIDINNNKSMVYQTNIEDGKQTCRNLSLFASEELIAIQFDYGGSSRLLASNSETGELLLDSEMNIDAQEHLIGVFDDIVVTDFRVFLPLQQQKELGLEGRFAGTEGRKIVSFWQNNLYTLNVDSGEKTITRVPEGLYDIDSQYMNGFITNYGRIMSANGSYLQRNLLGMLNHIYKPNKADPNSLMAENDGLLIKLSPCPSFSIKQIRPESGVNQESVTFEFTMTRTDGLADVWKGEACLVAWGDDGKAPLFAKLNEPRHKLGPLLPGMSQEITFKLPEPPLMEHNQKGEGKYFALVVESNGLMDREKSVLSEYDKDPRPLFDGTPVALDHQKAIVVTVWGR
ncbi:MAG: hypothetical protein ABFD23_03890 [Caldisericales bacterium]|nr:hypothetical protein [bacterium]